MSEYTPDNWIIVKFNTEKHGIFYKVLAGWSGGYLHGNSWKLNSGITSIKDSGDYWLIHGYSGSTYKCHKQSEFVRMNTAGVLKQLLDSGQCVEFPIEEYFKENKNDL